MLDAALVSFRRYHDRRDRDEGHADHVFEIRALPIKVRAIFEPVHFVMARRMMIGIKQLAEGQDRDRAINHLQIALWTMTRPSAMRASTICRRTFGSGIVPLTRHRLWASLSIGS